MTTYHFKREPWGADHERYDRVMESLGTVFAELTDWRDATLRSEEIETERDTLQERVEALEARVAELEADLDECEPLGRG